MTWNEKAGKEIELSGIEYIYRKENIEYIYRKENTTELEGK